MDSEKNIEEKLKLYTDLGKNNPGINVELLMANALNTSKSNSVSSRAKRWSFLISVGIPPFGLLFSLKYLFSDEDDAKQVAVICAVLTVFSLLFFWLISASLFSGSGSQIQQIKPNDILQLTQ